MSCGANKSTDLFAPQLIRKDARNMSLNKLPW